MADSIRASRLTRAFLAASASGTDSSGASVDKRALRRTAARSLEHSRDGEELRLDGERDGEELALRPGLGPHVCSRIAARACAMAFNRVALDVG